MDCWISIGRLGFPDIWACSKFRSQQLIRLILLSSRLVYAFFSMPKGLIKGDMYVNTSFCEQTWLFLDGLLCNWQIGFPYIWGCSIFRSQQLFLLSARLVYACIFQCQKDLSFHNVSQKTVRVICT